MKNTDKKIFIISVVIMAIIFTITGCDDENDIRDEQWEKESAEWSKNYGTHKADDYVPPADPGTDEVTYYEDTEGVDSGEIPEGPVEEIFKIGSDLAVSNGGNPATVEIATDVYATELWTYHYNGGSGAPGGTIQMKAEGGEVYGPWEVEVRNSFYWVATVNQTIPAGTYTVTDSDPGTWAHNTETNGQGMTWMMGVREE